MTRTFLLAATLLLFVVGGAALAQTSTIVVTPDQVKWAAAKGLPAGFQTAVLAGDPTKRGPYVQRVKLPPNAMVPPHTHPDAENITVLAGSFGIGEGTVVDKSKGRILTAGSFYHLPASTPHYAWAGADGAEIQIHGVGPAGIKMLQSSVRNY